MTKAKFDSSERREWYEVQWYDHTSKRWIFSYSGPELQAARGHVRFHEGSVDAWRIVKHTTEIITQETTWEKV